MRKRLGISYLVAIFSLFGCGGSAYVDPAESAPEEPTTEATSARMVVDPSVAMYLGDGYDLLTGRLRNTAIDIDEAARTEGERYYQNSYAYVANSADLEEKMGSTFRVSADTTLYGSLNISASLSSILKTSIQFSTKKVTMVGMVNYREGTAFVGSARVKPKALAVYDNGPQPFREQYGDGYVDQAVMGEALYLVFQYDFSSAKSHTETEIAAAAGVRFAEIFTGEVNAEQKAQADKVLRETTIVGTCYATGGFTPGTPIATREDFLAVFKKFDDFVQSKVLKQLNVPFNVLAKSFASYAYLLGAATTSIDSFYRMRTEWLSERAKIESVCNTNVDVEMLCQSAFQLIDTELQRCQQLEADARSPVPGEFQAVYDAVDTGPLIILDTYTNGDATYPPVVSSDRISSGSDLTLYYKLYDQSGIINGSVNGEPCTLIRVDGKTVLCRAVVAGTSGQEVLSTLQIEATDGTGHTSITASKFLIDKKGPTISVSKSGSRGTGKAQATVSYKATDSSGILDGSYSGGEFQCQMGWGEGYNWSIFKKPTRSFHDSSTYTTSQDSSYRNSLGIDIAYNYIGFHGTFRARDRFGNSAAVYKSFSW